MSLVLASGSPRRRELLGLITQNFTVVASEVDEGAITAPTPEGLVQKLARAKCLAVAESRPGDVVIGCDTIVEKDGKVYGKPTDAAAAAAMLRALSGQTHRVHTGVCITQGEKREEFVATSLVKFYPLTKGQIAAYAASGEPLDKAGGYAIQGGAALFCEGIEGCYYNIMGLPVSRVARALLNFL